MKISLGNPPARLLYIASHNARISIDDVSSPLIKLNGWELGSSQAGFAGRSCTRRLSGVSLCTCLAYPDAIKQI